jgi:hypothetical protein
MLSSLLIPVPLCLNPCERFHGIYLARGFQRPSTVLAFQCEPPIPFLHRLAALPLPSNLVIGPTPGIVNSPRAKISRIKMVRVIRQQKMLQRGSAKANAPATSVVGERRSATAPGCPIIYVRTAYKTASRALICMLSMSGIVRGRDYLGLHSEASKPRGPPKA